MTQGLHWPVRGIHSQAQQRRRIDSMKDLPVGATHIDSGPSTVKWLRISGNTHDYWCEAEKRWITFEGGHNIIRDHWVPLCA